VAAVPGRNDDEKPSRIQLTLPPQSVGRLEALRKMTEAASSSEVIRNAIRVYEGLVKEVHNGSTILIKESDGTLSQIRIY
jgi:Arc/MetJ-type ribon-helix-helix transcriptional regulator